MPPDGGTHLFNSLSVFPQFTMKTDKELLAQEALDAFWNVIARKFPEAKTGDLSPLKTFQLDRAAEAAVSEWIRRNVPNANSETSTMKPPAHTARPWAVMVTPGGTLYITGPERAIAALCDNTTPEEIAANAILIAAAPDLRRESQSLYDAIQAYLIDVPDRDLPDDLVTAFDSLEAAWHKSDGTKPEADDL